MKKTIPVLICMLLIFAAASFYIPLENLADEYRGMYYNPYFLWSVLLGMPLFIGILLAVSECVHPEGTGNIIYILSGAAHLIAAYAVFRMLSAFSIYNMLAAGFLSARAGYRLLSAKRLGIHRKACKHT